MGLRDLFKSAARIDAQRAALDDISHKAQATGTHLHDQYDAKLRDLRRKAGRK